MDIESKFKKIRDHKPDIDFIIDRFDFSVLVDDEIYPYRSIADRLLEMSAELDKIVKDAADHAIESEYPDPVGDALYLAIWDRSKSLKELGHKYQNVKLDLNACVASEDWSGSTI